MSSKIKVGMVQINNSFSNQAYFPYSIGILQAFSCKDLGREADKFEFMPSIYSRVAVEDAVSILKDADLVCFSAYVWNMAISLKIAGKLKKNRPETVIVFGGPQVPNRETEAFMRRNAFIDLACHDEGERIFSAILKNYEARSWENVSSASYFNQRGDFVRNASLDRISQLDKIPSPYLDGIFDPLIEAAPQINWVALWETNRGCPFSCAYCDWGSATKDKVYAYDIERLFMEIDWFTSRKIEFIFCCDANFSILKRDIELVRHIVENKRKFGYPKAFSVQSTKNFTEDSYEIYRIMSEAGLNKGVSLSFQSLNKATLKDTRRSNVAIEVFKEVQEKLSALKIETFTDLILGLPNETYESFADGASAIIENGQHNRIQFNNLSILPNAEMGNPDYQARFGFNTVRSKIINIHGALGGQSQVYESQQLVVGTKSMPARDWVKARVFGWMTALLHFDKLLQIPFLVLHKLCCLSLREQIELFTDSRIELTVLSGIRDFFYKKAADIQNGGHEFCESKEWLNIWWPADELILIRLCAEGRLDDFYKEAVEVLSRCLKEKGFSEYQDVLESCVLLSRNLMKLPFNETDIEIKLPFNIWDYFSAALKGEQARLRKGIYCYRIDRTSRKWPSWEDWCRKVVWYGNKRGAYNYSCLPVESQQGAAERKSVCL